MWFWIKNTGKSRVTISDTDYSSLPKAVKAEFDEHIPYHEEEPTHAVKIEGAVVTLQDIEDEHGNHIDLYL